MITDLRVSVIFHVDLGVFRVVLLVTFLESKQRERFGVQDSKCKAFDDWRNGESIAIVFASSSLDLWKTAW